MKQYTEFQTLGSFLLHLRNENGFTQAQLGLVVFPNKSHASKIISKFEKNLQRIQKNQLPKIAEALCCTEAVLLEAVSYFDSEKNKTIWPWVNSTHDLRPLFKSLSESPQPVTGKMIPDVITHWLALKEIGV